MVSNKNEIFEYLINQLRQQVNSNQCEDLAREIQSLKNKLRDVLALVVELQGDNIRKSEHISHLTGQVKGLTKQLALAAGDVEAYIAAEQSGCRKEDVQECGKREWDAKGYKPKNDTQKCKHEWVEFHGLVIAEGDPRNEPGYTFCRKCGLKEYSRKCEHEWSYVMGDGPGIYECDVCGAQSKTLPYDLRWLAL